MASRMVALIALVGITFYTVVGRRRRGLGRTRCHYEALFIVALQFLGRPTFLPVSLFAAALFMTLVNPLALWDVGFQLSFVAALGLILCVGPWSKRISDGKGLWWQTGR